MFSCFSSRLMRYQQHTVTTIIRDSMIMSLCPWQLTQQIEELLGCLDLAVHLCGREESLTDSVPTPLLSLCSTSSVWLTQQTECRRGKMSLEQGEEVSRRHLRLWAIPELRPEPPLQPRWQLELCVCASVSLCAQRSLGSYHLSPSQDSSSVLLNLPRALTL